MIKVLRVNKKNNRIQSYTCSDGNKIRDISKNELIRHIDNKNVSNAKKQVYNGKTIIRLVETSSTNNITLNDKEKKPIKRTTFVAEEAIKILDSLDELKPIKLYNKIKKKYAAVIFVRKEDNNYLFFDGEDETGYFKYSDTFIFERKNEVGIRLDNIDTDRAQKLLSELIEN